MLISNTVFLTCMCSKPMNLALVCMLFEDLEGNLPECQTQILCHIVLSMVKRDARRRGLRGDILDIEDLHNVPEFSKFCLFAYQTLKEGKFVFTMKELAKWSLSETNHFGLLQHIPTSSYNKTRPDLLTYTHRSLVEFCAALHLLFKDSMEKYITENVPYDDGMHMTLVYLCGLIGSEASTILYILTIMGKVININWLHYLNEATNNCATQQDIKTLYTHLYQALTSHGKDTPNVSSKCSNRTKPQFKEHFFHLSSDSCGVHISVIPQNVSILRTLMDLITFTPYSVLWTSRQCTGLILSKRFLFENIEVNSIHRCQLTAHIDKSPVIAGLLFFCDTHWVHNINMRCDGHIAINIYAHSSTTDLCQCQADLNNLQLKSDSLLIDISHATMSSDICVSDLVPTHLDCKHVSIIIHEFTRGIRNHSKGGPEFRWRIQADKDRMQSHQLSKNVSIPKSPETTAGSDNKMQEIGSHSTTQEATTLDPTPISSYTSSVECMILSCGSNITRLTPDFLQRHPNIKYLGLVGDGLRPDERKTLTCMVQRETLKCLVIGTQQNPKEEHTVDKDMISDFANKLPLLMVFHPSRSLTTITMAVPSNQNIDCKLMTVHKNSDTVTDKGWLQDGTTIIRQLFSTNVLPFPGYHTTNVNKLFENVRSAIESVGDTLGDTYVVAVWRNNSINSPPTMACRPF